MIAENTQASRPIERSLPPTVWKPLENDTEEMPMSPIELNRREMMEGTAMAAMLATFPGDTVLAVEQASPGGMPAQLPTAAELRINGRTYPVEIDVRATLLDALRERIGLTGTKKGCDRGECGACTVHIDGRRVLSCMTLAVMAEGKEITTIEGLAEGDALHPVQAAFIEHDAFQCGYCTSGQIMSAVACIGEGYAGSDDEIREFMSGNICRCSAYPQIVAAVKSAAQAREI
jgi:xanthine dehydrogenase YagT iron-sulfur-binding subunit